MALLHRLALPAKRCALHRSHCVHVLVQLRCGRVRGLPRLWPRCGRGLWSGHPQRQADPARRRGQTHADTRLAGMPGRLDAPRRGGRHSPRYALVQADRGAEALGHQGLAQLEWQVEPALVWRGPVLCVPGDQSLQDAHPRALVQVPQLHHLPDLQWLAAQDREPVVAHWHQCAGGCGVAARQTLHARGGEVVARATGGAAGPVSARHDADVAGQVASLLRFVAGWH